MNSGLRGTKLSKKNLSEALGYEIVEPENAYKFKFWEPFCKSYSDTKNIDCKQIIFTDYLTFS